MNKLSHAFLLLLFLGCGYSQNMDRPDPVSNSESRLMLKGNWFEDPHDIDFDNLPKIPHEHVIVRNAQGDSSDEPYRFFDSELRGGVTNHCNLIFHDEKFWLMWSDGPGVEDRVGQVVTYATSTNGLKWTDPKEVTPFPPNSGPDSEYYNTRTDQGMRWIARGFWEREGELLALVALDEAAGFFGPSLKLKAFRWKKDAEAWEDAGLIYDNAINNFPPKKLPTGEWMMSRRGFDYQEKGVDFMIGGVARKDQWEVFPVLGTNSDLSAEEPYWWVLPDDESLMALFRDNQRSGFLYRAFSIDNGRTWSKPVKTNFPDARSKFHGIRLSDGRYVLISNPNPERRDPLAISISDDGMVFTKMGYLVGGRHIDYPNAIEHDGYIYVAYGGSLKQKVEVLKIRISDLDKLDMSNYRPR